MRVRYTIRSQNVHIFVLKYCTTFLPLVFIGFYLLALHKRAKRALEETLRDMEET